MTGPRRAAGALRMTPGRWVALAIGVPIALVRPAIGESTTASGTTIIVGCRIPAGICGLNATLDVPPNTAVRLTSGGGNMQVSDIESDVTLDSGGGNVAVFGVGGIANVSTGGGNLTASDLAGILQFTTSGGNVNGNSLSAPQVTTDSGGGNVTLVFTKVPANLDIVSSGGDIPARWLSRGMAGIGTCSFLADLGHEIPTALLPSLLTRHPAQPPRPAHDRRRRLRDWQHRRHPAHPARHQPAWPRPQPGPVTQLALVLYVLYNIAATVMSIPAGRHGDRYNPLRVLAAGAICFAAGYRVFAAGPRQPWLLAAGFILAGLGIGCGETASSAAVAALAPATLRGSAFGLLATAQAGANFIASAVAAILWTAVSLAAAFLFLAAAMIISVPLILASRRSHASAPGR